MAYYRTQTQAGSGEKVSVGTLTNTSSSVANVSVNIGFKPKRLTVWYYSGSTRVSLVYDEDYSTTTHMRGTYTSSNSAFTPNQAINSSVGNALAAINNDGFTVRSSGSRTWHYYAIG